MAVKIRAISRSHVCIYLSLSALWGERVGERWGTNIAGLPAAERVEHGAVEHDAALVRSDDLGFAVLHVRIGVEKQFGHGSAPALRSRFAMRSRWRRGGGRPVRKREGLLLRVVGQVGPQAIDINRKLLPEP